MVHLRLPSRDASLKVHLRWKERSDMWLIYFYVVLAVASFGLLIYIGIIDREDKDVPRTRARGRKENGAK